MATREQLMAAMRKAHDAGDTGAATRFAGMIQAMDSQAPVGVMSPQLHSQLQQPSGPRIEENEQGRFLVNENGQWLPIDANGQQDQLLSAAIEANPNDLSRAESVFTEATRMRTQDSPETRGTVGQFLGDKNIVPYGWGSNASNVGDITALLRGVPFAGEWMDEAAGGIAGAFGGDSEAHRDRFNVINDAYQIAEPTRNLVANVEGGIVSTAVPMLQGAKLLNSGSLLSRISKGAGLGALFGGAEGAVSGAGAADEGARAEGAKQGALFGTVTGAGIGALIPGGGALAGALYRSAAGRKAREAARNLGMREDVAGLLGDRVRADASGTQQYLDAAGESATLGGLGPSTRGLLDSVANAPGPGAAIARENVTDIVEGASDRFTQTLDDVLGAPSGPQGIQAGIMTGTRTARNEAYNAAYSTPINYADEAGVRLQGLLDRVDPAVVKRAERLMQSEGVPSEQIMASVDVDGRVLFDTLPDVRQINYITRALRDTAGFAGGLGRDEARVTKALAAEIRGTLDELVPDYATARNIAGDAISEREAVDFGRTMLRPSVTREDVSLEIANMGQAELARVRQGLRGQIDDAMANVKRGLTRTDSDPQSVLKPLRDLTSPAAREKVAAILGPDEASRLFGMLDEAEQAFSLRTVTGSQTAQRLQNERAIDELLPQGVARTIEEEGLGQGLSSIAGRAMRAGGKTDEQAKNEIREYLAQTLTETGGVGPRAQQLSDFADLGDRMVRGEGVAQQVGAGAVATTAPVAAITSRPEYNNRPALLRRLSEMGFAPNEIVEIMNDPARLQQTLEAR